MKKDYYICNYGGEWMMYSEHKLTQDIVNDLPPIFKKMTSFEDAPSKLINLIRSQDMPEVLGCWKKKYKK